MTPEEHARLWPNYPGDRNPRHGTRRHRWWIRTQARIQLFLISSAMDAKDQQTRGRDLTPEEEEWYRKGATMRRQLVATLRAHGG